jgi:hypothetical protein
VRRIPKKGDWFHFDVPVERIAKQPALIAWPTLVKLLRILNIRRKQRR